MTTSRLKPISPSEAAEALRTGRAMLIDVREPDEFARVHVEGARSAPLSGPNETLAPDPGKAAIYTCRSGARTSGGQARLAACAAGEAYVLEGGIDGWRKAGLPVREDAGAPIEIMRQVQIAAGSLVLTGVVLGFLVHPGLFGVAALVGAGLLFAGVSGFCGMARLLMRAPWNQRPA